MNINKLLFLKIVLFCSLALLWGCTKGHDGHSMHSSMSASADNKIHVKEAWIRAVPPSSKMSAAYMVIMNHGENDDQLISVKTELSQVAEIHNVVKKDGMMKMLPVPFVDIPSGGDKKLKPGSYHIMLIKLNRIPKKGYKYDLILHFKRAGTVKVNAEVKDGPPKEKGMTHDHG